MQLQIVQLAMGYEVNNIGIIITAKCVASYKTQQVLNTSQTRSANVLGRKLSKIIRRTDCEAQNTGIIITHQRRPADQKVHQVINTSDP